MNTFIVDGFYPGPECTLNRYLTHASQSVNDKKNCQVTFGVRVSKN